MSKETFIWTDSLVWEFSQLVKADGDWLNLSRAIDKFKQSKMPKKDKGYEVIEIINSHGGKITKLADDRSWDDWCGLKSFDGFKINAVKRFSDGEVFKVGEDVEYSVNGDPTEIYYTGVIKDIKIPYPSNNEIMCLIKGVSHPDESLYFVDKIRHPKLPPQKEQSKPEQPKRIEVEGFGVSWVQDRPEKMLVNLKNGGTFGQEMFPAIKAAIERVLNDDEDADIKFAESKGWTCVRTHEYQLKLREAEEKAFNAARKMVHSGSYVEDQLEKVLKSSLESMAAYKDAPDYLNHKSKQ